MVESKTVCHAPDIGHDPTHRILGAILSGQLARMPEEIIDESLQHFDHCDGLRHRLRTSVNTLVIEAA